MIKLYREAAIASVWVSDYTLSPNVYKGVCSLREHWVKIFTAALTYSCTYYQEHIRAAKRHDGGSVSLLNLRFVR